MLLTEVTDKFNFRKGIKEKGMRGRGEGSEENFGGMTGSPFLTGICFRKLGVYSRSPQHASFVSHLKAIS